ncbi:MAG: DUF4388 domain-containing protein [Myxococcota bacterium]
MGQRVLLVDADLALLRQMRNAAATEAGGFELLTAQTWEAATELLSIAEPALIVGSVESAESVGLTQLRRLQARNHRVVALGRDVPELIRAAASAGVTNYICKPISPAAFFVQVQQYTRKVTAETPSLSGFALADLLQLVSMSRQSMTLRVRCALGNGELIVAGGSLVHATAGNRRGLDAAVAILGWRDSQVSSSPDVPPQDTWTIDVPLMELLVDAARLRDESARDEAKRQLEELVSQCVEARGVIASALVHVASRSEVHGEGDDGFDRSFALDIVLDALCLGDDGGERPAEVQLSFSRCDVLGMRLVDTGVVHLVWCEPGEMLSGTHLALRHLQAKYADGLPEAFSTIGIELESESDDLGRAFPD